MNGGSNQPGIIISFHSLRGGTGGTMTIANVAVILATAGKRVLVSDTAPSAPALRRYLGRFLPHARHGPAAQAEPVSLDLGGLAGAGGCLDLAVVLDDEASGPSGWGEPAAVRKRLRDAGYDYVLARIPARTGPAALRWSALLSDIAVIGFPLSPSAIAEAAEAVGRIGATGGAARVLPLPMMVDHTRTDRLEAARRLLRESLGASPLVITTDVEIPYSGEHYFTDELAVLSEPATRSGLRDAYEGVAARLTGGLVTSPRRVSVVHTSHYRVWGEWLSAQISGAGLRVREIPLRGLAEEAPAGLGGDALVLVVSPARLSLDETDRLDVLTGAWRETGADGMESGLVFVRVDDDTLAGAPRGVPELDIRGEEEVVIKADLRRRLRIRDPLPVGPGPARFPRMPTAHNLPTAERPFVGRQRMLNQLRDRLLTSPGGRCVLHGGPGVGKSEVALEYAHRFLGGYDIVWWIRGEHEDKAREDLRALAQRLELPEGGDAVAAVLRYLSAAEARWLLVFDDLDRPEDLPGLVPAEGGHVLLTTRRRPGDDRTAHLAVGPLSPAESAALLRRGDPHITTDDARQVTSMLAGMPLATEMARAWLARAAADPLRARVPLRERAAQAIAELRVTYGRVSRRLEAARRSAQDDGADLRPVAPHESMVAAALESLEPAELWIMQACSYLSPDGVSLDLLRSPAFLAPLSGLGGPIGDPLEIDAVLSSLRGYGMARIVHGRGESLRTHRLVRDCVAASMDPATRDRRGKEVARGLAAFAPAENEGPGDLLAHRFGELNRHLLPSRAVESADPAVRRWVIDQVRHLFRLQDHSTWRRALRIGELALGEWTSGGDPSLVPELRVQIANVQRELGDHAAAARHSEAALGALVRRGAKSVRALHAAMVHGADLRAQGDFDLAYLRSSAAWTGLDRLLGPHSPHTGRALNNLAVSASLAGKPYEAEDLARRCHLDRAALYGEADPATWWTGCNLAYFMRELGDDEGSLELLRRGLGLLAPAQAKAPGPRGLLLLRVECGIAVCERRLGRSFEALSRDTEALDELREVVGERHAATVLCSAAIAADLHAEGDHAGAVVRAHRAVSMFRDVFGERHPHGYALQANLATYLRAVGDTAEAARLGAQSCEALADRLGPRHPLALAAEVNHANSLAPRDRNLAVDRMAGALERLLYFYGPGHPHVRICERNLADLRRESLGGRHDPSRRRDIDIEVMPY
ncbi:FxSxx-COOH system tetratricopeptide repeat protein [Spongiactinospora sp. TRM90649]|uniref:FxSxx-COOH system tetratricopeptide repeat protein n=1 Tax=Spongiactinospora sp. TRM90649 TaxID=3031114 RepID=UPI0023F8BC64|nr:FxSxx-COOH system tetratricopeptide repeat protein [Spongiactinospora sp. TRM90649]MDF5755841.1 FxSxx-COOH system tetratricopeptide repeat protein [Spongiactinospora sp. TRM90649]